MRSTLCTTAPFPSCSGGRLIRPNSPEHLLLQDSLVHKNPHRRAQPSPPTLDLVDWWTGGLVDWWTGADIPSPFPLSNVSIAVGFDRASTAPYGLRGLWPLPRRNLPGEPGRNRVCSAKKEAGDSKGGQGSTGYGLCLWLGV